MSKLKLSNQKLRFLYNNILKHRFKTQIARKMCLEVGTLDDYIKQGKHYLSEHEDSLESLLDIQTIDVEEYIEGIEEDTDRFDLEQKFCEKNGISGIGDRYKNNFETYVYDYYEDLREEFIYKKQEEIFSNLKLVDDKELNSRIILYIKFYLIWERAHLRMSTSLQESISKYARSSKHLQYGWKLLELENKEEMGFDKKQEEKNPVKQINNITNFVELSLHNSQLKSEQLKQITGQDSVIDAEIIE